MQAVRSFFREAALVAAAIVRPALRSLRENPGLAAASVVLAFGLWIIVTEAENPTRTRVFEQDLPVEPINVDPSVAVANDLRPVRVRVSVEEDVFQTLTVGDFEATVDLEGLTVGPYKRPVEVRRLSGRGGLRVEEVIPPEIDVVLVPRESKRVPVVIDVTGEPAPGFAMRDPELEETEVTVSGPGDKVALVARAAAQVDVEGRAESFNQGVRLKPRDENGNLVTKVTVDPPVINVSIRIEQTTFSRPVTVSPAVRGTPADGYRIVSVSSKPPIVTVKGDQPSVSAISAVATEEVDVEGETETIVRTVSLDLPPGVTVIGSSSVTVTVRIEPAQGSVRFTVPLVVQGLGPGLSVRSALPQVKVTLRGMLPDLLELTADDVRAVIDLTGKESGVHKVPVRIEIPQGLDADATAEPGEIELTLGGT